MKLNITFEHEIPAALAEELGISEDSAFEAYYADGALHVRLLTAEEAAEMGLRCPVVDALCEGECETCAVWEAVCCGKCSDCCFLNICAEGRDDS